ncbi:furin-like protease 1 isoform X2 [Daphnia pulex]|uniref:furin-like protease 1 isoform X2 n=1 Tax=Daphnia pulex TaxID=6669 RepID=UPI001EDFE449|nr:furin-like protease 1 isoform X2 [Daphnia pulex]XP_046438551.1 furin-like protease 1 isoform X2 [Daphnia pulex]
MDWNGCRQQQQQKRMSSASSRILTMLSVVLLVLATGLAATATSSEEDDGSSTPPFTDQWAVHISGGDQVADAIAARHGFTNLGKIFGDYYHFQHRKVAKRSIEPGTVHSELLNNDPEVRWVKQQVVKKRVKRDFIQDTSSGRSPRSRNDRRPSRKAVAIRSEVYNLNDPRWTQMWYLNRGMGLDMNVREAWAEGVTGKGTVVTILDDGLEKDHPDIRRNYDPLASYDVNNHDEDPMPRYDLIDSNRHGTRCAGEVAAEGNNSICAVGVAFDAGIGGVRMLDGDVTDAVEARSLSLNPHHIDIYSASWGPDDDGKTVDGPGELATRAFIEGVTKGRGGKGSIFVWASGNGGRDHDNCNCDGYTNSIWTLSISSATENGYVPWYSEACSSTLATTYSSGSSGEKQIVTTDLHHSCTASHTGTSASAPLAAGICALALEANRNLTWRDMQHIVVRTARPANLKADDWQVNGVGRNVSHSFGYGLMDAAAMVRLARGWVTVAPQQFCEVRAPDTNRLIPAKSQIKIQLTVRECAGVNFMEHLQARISLAAVSRGDIQIHLSSPSGTRSTLLALRPHDSSRNGFHSWPFMSVHYWGESPFGVWTLEIQNEGRYLATLAEWNVAVYGTKDSPDSRAAISIAPTAAPPTLLPTVAVQPPTPRVLEKEVSTRLQPPSTSAATVSAAGDWLDKSTIHQNNLEQNNARASSLPNGGHLPEPVTVLSSSSGGARVGCRPGHWDSASAVCLMCEDGGFLLQGQCVATCPESTHATNRTGLTGILPSCVPCHYSCLTCDGPSDSECVSCHADSQLKSVISPGFKGRTEKYCHPRELATLLASYERWSLGVELALAFNLAIVVSLVVFLLCTRKPGCGSSCILNCCTKGGANQSDKKKKKKKQEYHHLVSTTSLNKSSNLVVDVYTDEPDDDEPESQRRPIINDK